MNGHDRRDASGRREGQLRMRTDNGDIWTDFDVKLDGVASAAGGRSAQERRTVSGAGG